MGCVVLSIGLNHEKNTHTEKQMYTTKNYRWPKSIINLIYVCLINRCCLCVCVFFFPSFHFCATAFIHWPMAFGYIHMNTVRRNQTDTAVQFTKSCLLWMVLWPIPKCTLNEKDREPPQPNICNTSVDFQITETIFRGDISATLHTNLLRYNGHFS